MAGSPAIAPIDLAKIAAADDAYTIIEPVWHLGNIYEGATAYGASLVRFSQPQRHVWAICWYRAEVNNGGHDQFYSNSTGIVWRDALHGFEAAGLPMFADILRASTARFTTEPSLDRQTRNDELVERELDFDDLDEAFYAAEAENDLDVCLTDYARAHADDFLFEGQAAQSAPVVWFRRILALFRPTT